MTKATTWTAIWIDIGKTAASQSKPVLDYQRFDNLKDLELKVISLSSQSTQYTVVTGDILEVSIDTSPRVTIGGTPTPAKKTRATRSDKGATRGKKAAMSDVVDLAVKTFNGGAA